MTQPLLAEGRRLADAILEQDLMARLSGGVGIALCCPSIARIAEDREFHDIDLCAASADVKKLQALLADLEYQPAERFNALNADQQLMFDCESRNIHLDVFIDRLRMCHTLDFSDRLRHPGPSLDPTDLLLSKLQIVQLTHKDTQDLFAIILDHETETSAQRAAGSIDLRRIAAICGGDWGWYTTVQRSIAKLIVLAESALKAADRELVTSRTGRIRDSIEAAPKTLRWKARSRIGERVRWYELPEETLAH